MNSLKHKKNTESRSIEILFNDNQMCCGMCVENFLSNYVLCVVSYQRLEKIRRLLKIKEGQRIDLRDLDLINKGRVLERLIYDIKQIDPFDSIDAWKFSRLISYLRYYLSEEFINEELKDTYAENVIKAFVKKKLERKKQLRMNELRQVSKNKELKALKLAKRIAKEKRKNEIDLKRSKLLPIFIQLNPIEKLRFILDSLDIPLQSIPDYCLFESSLQLRCLVQKEFDMNELSKLRKLFGVDKKNNKRAVWRKIMKVLK